jgi:hypothetical protein
MASNNNNVNNTSGCVVTTREQTTVLKYEQKTVNAYRYAVNIVRKELRKYVKTFAFKVSAAGVIIAGTIQLYYIVKGV